MNSARSGQRCGCERMPSLQLMEIPVELTSIHAEIQSFKMPKKTCSNKDEGIHTLSFEAG